MVEQKKAAHASERNDSFIDKLKDNCTIEYLGTGVSYLGEGKFQIPVFSNSQVQFEEVGILSDKYKCRNALTDVLARWVYPYLNMSEIKVLNYICNRTILFFKTHEVITQNQFLWGVKGVDSGSGIHNKGNLSTAIRKLREKGFIKHDPNGKVNRKGRVVYGSVFMIDFNFINEWVKNTTGGLMKKTNIVPFEYAQEHFDYDFDPSEMCDEVLKNKTTGFKKQNHEVLKNKPLNKGNKQVQKTSVNSISVAVPSETASMVDSKESLKEKTTQVSSTKESERREAILSKEKAYLVDNEGNKVRVSVPKAIQYFIFLTKEYYPGRVFKKPSDKESGKLFGMVKNIILSTDFPEGDIFNFLDFVVPKWDTIKVQHFEFINRGRESRGMSEILYPEFPDLNFICQFKVNFLSAYQKEIQSKLSALDLYADRLRAKGMSEGKVTELSEQKIAADCDYQKTRADYYKGLEDLKVQRELLEMEKKNAQREVQEARKSVYILKMEADKEANKLAALQASQMAQKTISTTETVSTEEEDPVNWNGLSEQLMKNLSQKWVEKYIPGFAEWTPELYEAIFEFEFMNQGGDMTFVYDNLKADGGRFYDRRPDLQQYDKEYAILESRGDQAGINDLNRFYKFELTPGFKRFK